MKRNTPIKDLVSRSLIKWKSIFLMVSFYLINCASNLYSQSSLQSQLIDSKSNNGIPYAYIKIAGKNLSVVSDEDGFFIIPCTNMDTIIISHVAYKTLKIPYNKTKTSMVIKMTELPVELNPIIISAKSAQNTIKRAIDSTYSTLSIPLYFRCFRKDQICFRDTLIIEAKAEILMELENLFSPSHGGVIKCYLENIKVEKNTNHKINPVPKFSISAVYAPINRFIAGVSKYDDKLLCFSYQEANDSIIIISFKPKSGHIPNMKYVYKQGRFIINKNTGKFMRIDSDLSPAMMEVQRISMEKRKNPSLYYYNYSLSQFFDKQGYPQRIHWQLGFSLKENNPNNLWTNYSDQLFIKNEMKPQSIKNKILLKPDTALVEMKSNYNSNFERMFNNVMSK